MANFVDTVFAGGALTPFVDWSAVGATAKPYLGCDGGYALACYNLGAGYQFAPETHDVLSDITARVKVAIGDVENATILSLVNGIWTPPGLISRADEININVHWWPTNGIRVFISNPVGDPTVIDSDPDIWPPDGAYRGVQVTLSMDSQIAGHLTVVLDNVTVIDEDIAPTSESWFRSGVNIAFVYAASSVEDGAFQTTAAVQLDNTVTVTDWTGCESLVPLNHEACGFVPGSGNRVDCFQCSQLVGSVYLLSPTETGLAGLTTGPDGDIYAAVFGLSALESIQKFNVDDGIVQSWDVTDCTIPGAMYRPGIKADGSRIYLDGAAGQDDLMQYNLSGSACASNIRTGAGDRTFNTVFPQDGGTFYCTAAEGEAHDVYVVAADGSISAELDGPEWAIDNEAKVDFGCFLYLTTLWLIQDGGGNFYTVERDTPTSVLLEPIDSNGGNNLIKYLAFSPLPDCELSCGCPSPSSILLGDTYSGTLSVTGGVAPYTFAVTGGSLPPGIELDAFTGELAGVPTILGNYPYTIEVTDSIATTGTVDCTLVVYTGQTYPLLRLRRFQGPFNQNFLQILSRIEIVMQAGVGNSEAPAPTITLRLSKNGGQTWAISRDLSIGAAAAYLTRVYSLNFGKARNPVIELCTSDPVFIGLLQCNVDYEVCQS